LPLTDVAYREELAHFFRCIIRDKNPEVDAKWGLMVQKIVDAARISDREGRFVKVTE
jgi:predicted dehydrogenase